MSSRLPPDAPGAAPDPTRPVEVRVGGAATRPPGLPLGLLAAVLAGLLAAAAAPGAWLLAVAVVAVQVVAVLALLALLDAPGSGPATALALAVVVAADTVALTQDGEVGGFAGVVGLSVVGAFALQLLRRGRSRVTESVADALLVALVVVAAACLVALRSRPGGQEAFTVAMLALAAALVAGRVGDLLAPRPVLVSGAARGWPGLVLGLGAGALAGALVAGSGGAVVAREGLLLGVLVAAVAVAADLTVDLAAAELRAGWRDARRVAALRPAGLLLPLVLAGPVVLVAGRLTLT